MGLKTLSTEQQAELQILLEEVAGNFHDHGTLGQQLRYWAIELKPKRVRKKNIIETPIIHEMNPESLAKF